MLRPSNWISPPKIIPPRNPSACEECGLHRKNIENGVKHPYCSRQCAKRAASARLPLSDQSAIGNNIDRVRDRCEECGMYPKAIEQGHKHPYCSQTCAQNSKLRLQPNAKKPVCSDLCTGCGKNLQLIRGSTYCSEICARKSTVRSPTICLLLGCAAASSPAFGGLCSVAHSNEWYRRHGKSPLNNPELPWGLGLPRPRILFYHKHDPHYGFTNFSHHPIVYEGKTYPTSEHLFQSFKFQKCSPSIAEHIRTYSDNPSVALSVARQYQHGVRSDWHQVNIEKMDITLWHKFAQHLDLKAELLATLDAELVEDSDKDSFWGIGPDGRGRNELGKALERLRARFQEAA